MLRFNINEDIISKLFGIKFMKEKIEDRVAQQPPAYNPNYSANYRIDLIIGEGLIRRDSDELAYRIEPSISYPKLLFLIYPPAKITINNTDIVITIINIKGQRYEVTLDEQFPFIMTALEGGGLLKHLSNVEAIGEVLPDYQEHT